MFPLRPRLIILTILITLPLSLFFLYPLHSLRSLPTTFSDLHLPTSFTSSSITSRISGVLYIRNVKKLKAHPISRLIEEAKGIQMEKDQKLLDVAGRGLEGAVEDYMREFGMDPPEGFERW
jgi:hypothetical protein